VLPVSPFPWKTTLGLVWSLLSLRPRSFRQDALTAIPRLHTPLGVVGEENIPSAGACLLTMNHYAAPGFQAWWIALAISALVPVDIHWVMTAAWTFENRRFAGPLVPAVPGMVELTRRLFPRLARLYGFTPMPPMPPDPAEVNARAIAVRRVVEYARRTPRAVIGLSPEGQDHPGGCLGAPPPGVGRFIALLAAYCPLIHPIAVYQQDGRLVLNFAPPYRLELPAGDSAASHAVMLAIAHLLPFELRGIYAEETRFTD
jgi:1-acyl-sn-glycerol-3-phosphate acyltransferase